MYSKRDIVLVKFPFSNLIDFKIRPALVLHSSPMDVLLMMLTTTTQHIHAIALPATMVKPALYTDGAVRYDVVFNIEKDFVIRKIGVLDNSLYQNICIALYYNIR